ncbi:MAG: Uma2 family endonuclease [Candidatus Eremiobacteraeota bacterium]|nr:Uma2 family endonuclease [Candidatus Eremiobacteraeota bacterium]
MQVSLSEEVLDEKPYLEVLDGKVYPKVSPKRTHGLVQFAMLTILHRCSDGRGDVVPEWRIWPEGRGRTTLVPDVSYVSHERLQQLPPDQIETPPFSPDIAVEVRSPSNRPNLLTKKIERYLSTGSVLVLDIDPATQTVTAHSAYDVRSYCATEIFENAAVPWLVFSVSELFEFLELPR